ncbi:hypothetical protein [Kordiimonas marina]|uniref:hypothetical protein n=1 Tax=Kordiimonas marina TaxID=2872312 RepID=UPI001FF5DB5A|nr:hypothetical protein [Kordiimonas marina]MCJ9429477.1 hypothetical protein [Kordiimonas marina]
MMQLDVPLWTSAELRAGCGIASARPWYADRLDIAGQKVMPGTLYVALGHGDDVLDVSEALSRGAIAALVDNRQAGLGGDDPRLVHVDNTETVLRQMAVKARDRAPATRVAVLGDMRGAVTAILAQVFGLDVEVQAADEGLAPSVRIALALARLERSARYGLFDLEADADLIGLIAPHVVLVGAGGVQGVDGLLSALPKEAVLVVDITDKAAASFARRAVEDGRQVMTVSMTRKAAVRPAKIIEHSHCTCLSADIDGVPVTYKVGIAGADWVALSLMILAAVKAADADLGRAALCLAGLGSALNDDMEESDWAEGPDASQWATARRALAE